jgi:peptidoglycan/LPS O-acetylase OafA/YrhL
MERPAKPMDRVSGLDSIRFLCALWVFFGHGAAPGIPNPFADGSALSSAFRGFFGNIWSGPPAVIVFFVISGFCIHYPFAGSDKRPQLRMFYTRRFLRLLIPVCVAVPASKLTGLGLTVFQNSILWSLIAELIYYTLYPLLRAAQLRYGSWRGIVVISFVAAFAVAATKPTAGGYPMFGTQLNWLLGLPCWLLGCMLAEAIKTRTPQTVSTSQIWGWRMAIWGTASVCSVLRFHTPLGYPWTLNLFALLVFLWLRREIHFRQRVPATRFLEWAGLWSYSFYLVHVPAGTLFAKYFPAARGSALGWAFMVLFVLTICYVFYALVERPSHIIAQKAANKFRPPTEPSLTTKAAC